MTPPSLPVSSVGKAVTQKKLSLSLSSVYFGCRFKIIQFYVPYMGVIFLLNRPFAAKPLRDLLFIKLWAATLRMPEMEKACQKHQNGQVWSPWHYKMRFYEGLNFKKIKKICMEKVAGYFHTNLLIFFWNSNHHKISFFNARDLKLCHFGFFDMLFPFLAFFK